MNKHTTSLILQELKSCSAFEKKIMNKVLEGGRELKKEDRGARRR